MNNFSVKDKAGFHPYGIVSMGFVNNKTGRILEGVRLPQSKPNLATSKSKLVQARVFGGDFSYKPAFIEWGFGNTIPDISDENLDNPYVLTPGNEALEGIFTPILSVEYPSEGQVRLGSILSNTVYTTPDLNATPVSLDSFKTPPSPTGSIQIQEIMLRTAVLPGYPKGIGIARFVNDTSVTKSGSLIDLSAVWDYFYA